MRTLLEPARTKDCKVRGPTCPWPRARPRTATARRPSEPIDDPAWLPDLLTDAVQGDAGPSEPEGLGRASCAGPQVRVARSAIAAAADGLEHTTWRLVLDRHNIAAATVADAEDCARSSGIWPWASQDGRPSTSAQTGRKELA